jgi:hypothetical protein
VSWIDFKKEVMELFVAWMKQGYVACVCACVRV